MVQRRTVISRKVVGFPLQVRPESFVGVGQQNFSQTNTPGANASEKSKEIKQATRAVRDKLNSKLNLKFSRYALHGLAIAAIIGVASFGQINASQSITTRGSGSTKNQTSMINTAAILTSSTQSVIAGDVNQKAQDLNNLPSLPTAGNGFLANRSPVVAVGAPSREIIAHKVKQGETLTALSAKYNITTDTIKWANNLTDDNIQPGASLTILPVNGILHTAGANDDILALAETYKSNATLIESFNGLEGKAPTEGAKLIIPDGVKPVPTAPVAVTSRIAQNGNNNSAFTVAGLTGPGSFANTYSYGYCTWYVASRRQIPNNWGNAYSWLYMAQRSGYGTGNIPRAGAVAWGPGNHVAYVESVNGDGSVTVSEMNYYGGGGGWGRRSYRTTSASTFRYIY